MLGPPQCGHTGCFSLLQITQARTSTWLPLERCALVCKLSACVCVHVCTCPLLIETSSSLQEQLYRDCSLLQERGGSSGGLPAPPHSSAGLGPSGPADTRMLGSEALRREQETENSIGGFLTTSCYKAAGPNTCEHRHTLVMHAGTTALNTVI